MPAKLRTVLGCAESDSARCQPARSPTPCSVSLRRVRHRAELACTKSDTVQCQPARSPTPCSGSLHGVQHPAVFACAESDTLQCQPLLDFWKCHLLTPHSDSLREVCLRTVLVNFGFSKIFPKIDKWILNSLEIEMCENKTIV